MTEFDDPRPYFYRLRGNALGPFDLESMQQKAQRGIVSRITEISRDGSDWRKATEFPELFRRPTAAAPVRPEPMVAEAVPIDSPTLSNGWYIVLHGVQQPDPVPLSTVQQYVATGIIKKDDVVCRVGERNWSIVRSIPELAVFIREEEPRHESSNGLAIAGFVLSLLGCTAPLGFIFSLVALNSKNQSNRGLAIAGAVIGGLATIGAVLWLVWFFILVGAAANGSVRF